MRSRDYLEGYNDCLIKMRCALYDIQMIQPYDLVDLNNSGEVDNVLPKAEGKDNKGFALQDVVLYNDRVWKTQRAGMVVSSGDGILHLLTEKGSLAYESLEDVSFIGHIWSIKHPTTLIDAIKEVKMHYMEANKK